MVFSTHKFFCIKCGNEGIPIQRPLSKQREKFHYKKLYCVHCKEFVNHVEVRNFQEEEEFKTKFANGEYAEEIDIGERE